MWDWEDMAFGLFMTICLGVIVALVIALIIECRKETFDLAKADWHCTKSSLQTTTTMMLIGQVMIPQTSTQEICTQWSHN